MRMLLSLGVRKSFWQAAAVAAGLAAAAPAADPAPSGRRDELVAVVEKVKGSAVNIHSERVTGPAANIFQTVGLTTYALRSGQ